MCMMGVSKRVRKKLESALLAIPFGTTYVGRNLVPVLQLSGAQSISGETAKSVTALFPYAVV